MLRKLILLALLTVMTLALCPGVVSASESVPAAYWRLDDGPGSTAASDSIGGLRGSLHGGVTWSPAAVLLVNGPVPAWDLGRGRNDSAWALDFDGKSGYVEVLDTDVLRSDSFSIAFWASPDSTGDWDNVMGKQVYQNGEQSGWMICWDAKSPRRLVLFVFDQSHKGSSSVGVPMTMGEWTHIAFSVGNGSIGAYKNGLLVGRTVLHGYEPVSEPFRIGKAYGNGHYYDGLIDDVRFYNTFLLDDDVELLYMGYGYNGPGSLQISTVLEAVEVSITPGVENWLGAQLLDQRGRLLVGVPLSFAVDGNALGTGLTDNRGFVWIPYYPGGSSTRTLTLTVAFNGAEGFAGDSDTVQLAAGARASPLEQFAMVVREYAVILVITAATLMVVTALILYRRKMSKDLTETLRETLGESSARANIPNTPNRQTTSGRKYCKYCGTENDADAVFCQKCGRSIA